MSVLDRVLYRCRQFAGEIMPRSLPAEAMAEVKRQLSAAEWVLFQRFSLSDQNHSYAVMKSLEADGCRDKVLLQAALLHDIGKTRVPIYIWDRVLIVLGKLLAPQRVKEWGQGEPVGWRRPFVIKEMHPVWGAEMAQAAGSTEEVVQLIRIHQDPPDESLAPALTAALRQLQWADDQH